MPHCGIAKRDDLYELLRCELVESLRIVASANSTHLQFGEDGVHNGKAARKSLGN